MYRNYTIYTSNPEEPIISTPEGKNDGEIGRLTAQVKCTSQIRFDKGDCLVYPLPTKNYNELIKRSLDPRILILILVPDNVDKWIDVSSASQETLIRKCGYWKSLEGFPNTENKSTINVEIYKENILTPESLIQIIETAKQKRRELFI